MTDTSPSPSPASIEVGQIRKTNMGVRFRVEKIDEDGLVHCKSLDAAYGSWKSSTRAMERLSTLEKSD